MMQTRRGILRAAALAAVLAGAFAAGPARADDDLEAQAREALDQVFAALMTGDPEAVRPFLAPEYQIVRSDGGAYGKEDYLARSIPKIESAPVFTDVVATGNGDILVVRMRIRIEEHVDGKKAEAVFPHLIVFRDTPDGWQVVAAANFARLEE